MGSRNLLIVIHLPVLCLSYVRNFKSDHDVTNNKIMYRNLLCDVSYFSRIFFNALGCGAFCWYFIFFEFG